MDAVSSEVLGGDGAVNIEGGCQLRYPCTGQAMSDKLGDLVVAESLLLLPLAAPRLVQRGSFG